MTDPASTDGHSSSTDGHPSSTDGHPSSTDPERALSPGSARPGWRHRLGRVVARELRTVARTRTFGLLAAALAAVVVAIAWVGGGVRAGYVPAVVDLLTPLELLVPIVAVAFGYRAILGDRRRGELDVLETYPLSARELVVGVYVGRALALTVAVVVPLVVVGLGVVLAREAPLAIYATHAGADSPLLYARFVVLTAAFALTMLAVAVAVSALVGGSRSALALAVLALVVLLVGLDLALVAGLASGVLGESSLVHALAVSPLSAYRGLVFETVVLTAAGTGPRVASPGASLVGLLVWTVGSLAVATWGVKR